MVTFEAKELLQLADALTIERGQSYFFHKRVGKIIQQGDRFRAEVAGTSRYSTYLWSRPLSGRCSCPYGGKGACKHIIAMGMAVLAENPKPEVWEDKVPQGTAPPFSYLSQVNPIGLWEIFAKAAPHPKEILISRRTELERFDHLLAVYFAEPNSDDKLLQDLAKEYKQKRVPPFFAREMLAHLFEVWQKILRRMEREGKDLKINWKLWTPVIEALCVNKMVNQFLQIRIDAYQLEELKTIKTS